MELNVSSLPVKRGKEMKVIINFEDRIEVLFLSKDTSSEDSRYIMEVPDEFFAKYEKLENEYATMQEELTKLWDARIEFLMFELNEKKK
jgi:hypothetical protein